MLNRLFSLPSSFEGTAELPRVKMPRRGNKIVDERVEQSKQIASKQEALGVRGPENTLYTPVRRTTSAVVTV